MQERGFVAALSAMVLVGLAAGQVRADEAEHFEQLDGNGDRVVTLREFQVHALAGFTSADVNRDGKLSSEEHNALLELRSKERFSERDLNRDGVLDRSELEHMPRAVFYQIDLDGSGGLNANEMKAFARARQAERLAATDTDRDGAISQLEVLNRSRARFVKLDENRDGRIDEDEFHRGVSDR